MAGFAAFLVFAVAGWRCCGLAAAARWQARLPGGLRSRAWRADAADGGAWFACPGACVVAAGHSARRLLRSWQQSLPPDAPNTFLINVQPDQRNAVRVMIAEAGLPAPICTRWCVPGWWPSTTGRCTPMITPRSAPSVGRSRIQSERGRAVTGQQRHRRRPLARPRGERDVAGRRRRAIAARQRW